MILLQALLAGALAMATYASHIEIEGKIISFDEKNVVIEQSGESINIAKDTIQNQKEIKVGKKVILKVKAENLNQVEVPKNQEQK